MTEKSHVSIEQKICSVCGQVYDTKSLLLDTKLKERFDRNTITGWGLCPEHQKLFDDGYLAMVEIDPEKSTFNGNTLKPEDAYRTGRVAHLKREFAEHLLGESTPSKELPLSFIDKEVMDMLVEMSNTEASVEGDDV